MEGRSIERMIAVSKAVKGEMDIYLDQLGARTRENISVFDTIRKSSVKVMIEQTSKGAANIVIIEEK